MPIEILLVEDDTADIRLAQEAFRTTSSFVSIHVASDGLQAMDFLKQRGAYDGAPRPDIILLDLNLPLVDGRQLLTLIKRDEEFSAIPVFIVTGSEIEADRPTSLKNGANGFHRKPVHWEEFESLAKNITDFWANHEALQKSD